MKTCPICNAVTFDDADICFGCLHRYSDDVPESLSIATDEDPAPVASFTIKLDAFPDTEGYSWRCSVSPSTMLA